MITYRVGVAAEEIIAVRLDCCGTVTPILRRRDHSGALVSVPSPTGGLFLSEATMFTVRVPAGHSGTLEILPGTRDTASAHTLIPLGADLPLLESELPPSVGAAGSGIQGTSVEFRFEHHRLSWRCCNVVGQVHLNAEVSSVIVALRIPSQNAGEIVFPTRSYRASGCTEVVPSPP